MRGTRGMSGNAGSTWPDRIPTSVLASSGCRNLVNYIPCGPTRPLPGLKENLHRALKNQGTGR
eukprot:63509-Pleurochrysis_carterae.AAC.1